jgi:hypothetical protein
MWNVEPDFANTAGVAAKTRVAARVSVGEETIASLTASARRKMS